MTENSRITKEEIEKRAYQLYVAGGCQDGRDLQDWFAAEEQLKAESGETAEQRLRRIAVATTMATAATTESKEPTKKRNLSNKRRAVGQ